MAVLRPWVFGALPIVDAECTYKIDKEERWKEEIQTLASNKMHIFVPALGSPAHWALQVGHRSSPDAAWQFCYRDSLVGEHADCKHEAAILSYIEAGLAGQVCWPRAGTRGWKHCTSSCWSKLRKLMQKWPKKKKGKRSLKAKIRILRQAQAAKTAFEQNSQNFTHKDLSPNAREAVWRQSCTLQVPKAQVHSLPSLLPRESFELLVRKEAGAKSTVPKIQGPGLAVSPLLPVLSLFLSSFL